jgi:peptidyl-prolyl cis-trans isomerase A (cyclophilin A)
MLGLLLLLTSIVGFQQAATPPITAEIVGTVFERDGGVIPGATVSLETPTGAAVQKVVTNMKGAYRLEKVTPGTYTVTFELAGFQTYSRTRLTLVAGQSHMINVGLDVGWSAWNDYVTGRPPLPNPVLPLNDGEVAVGVATAVGTFYIGVDTRRAPITAANFLKYVEAGLYNSGRFHRATRADNYTPAPPARPMMNIIQGGINPLKRSEGFPAIPLERTSVTGIRHVTGVVSMARGTEADTATSDFFVLLDDQPSLDFGGQRFADGQGGAAFGRVVEGLDIVRKIQQQPVEGQNLSGPVTIRRVWRLGGK